MADRKTSPTNKTSATKKGASTYRDWRRSAPEPHRLAEERLTTNHGVPVSDNHELAQEADGAARRFSRISSCGKKSSTSIMSASRRIVHARGSGAHGYFELTDSLAEFSRARILTEVGARTEVFVRFSTVAGGAGSVDTPRDVRGFAVKFYSKEGNWDLVGNNYPGVLHPGRDQIPGPHPFGEDGS